MALPTPVKKLGAALPLACCLLAPPSRAQWAPCGVPLTLDPGGQDEHRIASDGAGGAIVVWRDYRDRLARDADVYAQRVTADGRIAPGWLADGVPVCTDSAYQDESFVVADGTSGAWVTWTDTRSYGTNRRDVYLQRLTADGAIAPGWAVNGNAVCRAPDEQFRPKLAPDGTGGVFVVWEDYRRGGWNDNSQTDIYAQHMTPEGNVAPGWPADGLPLCTFPGFRWTIALMPDSLGGFFIAWTDFRGTVSNESSDVYALRIGAQGKVVPGWVDQGVPICTAPGQQTLSTFNVTSGLVPDGQGGMIIAWVDHRDVPPGDPYPEYYADIYAQRVTPSGGIAAGWPVNGVALCTAPDIQWDHEIVSDGAGGAIVAWVDYRDRFVSASDLYAQRVLASGEIAPGWPANGTALSRGPGFELRPTMVADGAGGALIAYQSNEFQLFAQHVSSSGGNAPGWDPNGIPLCDLPSQQDPVAVSDGKGGMIVAWEDYRGEGNYDIYAQRVSGDYPTLAVFSLVSAEAHPGRVILRWSAGSLTPLSAFVYRRDADSNWKTLGAPSGEGDGMLVFEDRSVTAGRYAYRLGYGGTGGEVFTPEEWVTVPSGHVLALSGFSPNPTRSVLVISFSLASGEEATLEVFDVSGRAMVARHVGSLGPGRHRVGLGRDLALAPGVYWIRLTQAGTSLTAKGLVVR